METITFLPLVKAYPALSTRYGEISCVAGVELRPEGPRWIRLYPVPFRALGDSQKFAKYQPITVDVETHSGDNRPETRRPQRDSIKLAGDPLPSDHKWRARRKHVEPVIGGSMCEIQRRQAADGTSLGAFRPKRVLDLIIESVDVSAEKLQIASAWAAQGSLLDGLDGEERQGQIETLEQIPWRFKLRYECSDPGCRGHSQSIIDWEIAQFYRRESRHSDWRDRIRKKWLEEICGPEKDTAFFVGNQHLPRNRTSFLILGFWWPPIEHQMGLGPVTLRPTFPLLPTFRGNRAPRQPRHA